ncbi:hypothetical protein TWF970_003670 [Orbilia oligospora]|uniref:FAD-binding PCMH-type domain-containing protein n=1 Tax=Orbilia oligospora TaxID=2813651 RepID=A0A7C8VNT0_ORBOL|nr:hypothetical protein TWF970_003670 [Orbilia oligospora]
MENGELHSSELKQRLLEGTKIVGREGKVIRYDESSAPNPLLTIFPRSENDVAEIVKYCREKGLQCFAQSGGHNWRVRNHKKIDVVICMRTLNNISIDESTQTVTLGGGTIIGELVEAVTAKKLEVATGVCNTVGVLGTLLHGGTGRYTGKYGLGIDNLLSINIVDASGKLHQDINRVTDPELWWAICGAGSSFGIVTQATIKAYPQSNDGLSWNCTMIFTDPGAPELERILEAIAKTPMDENMSLQCSLACLPPTGLPSLIVMPWYYGSESEAEKVWGRLLDPSFKPSVKNAVILPGNKVNEGNDAICTMGGRKPGVGMGIERLDLAAFLEVWNLWAEFTKIEGAEGSAILIERFSKAKSLSIPDSATVFPHSHRGIAYEVVCFPIYKDETLDIKADAFSKRIRDIWVQKCGNPEKPRCYGACAGFDEPLENMFGGKERVQKLMKIKKKWDSENYWGALFELV